MTVGTFLGKLDVGTVMGVLALSHSLYLRYLTSRNMYVELQSAQSVLDKCLQVVNTAQQLLLTLNPALGAQIKAENIARADSSPDLPGGGRLVYFPPDSSTTGVPRPVDAP